MRDTRRDRGDKTGVKFAVGQVFQHKKVGTVLGMARRTAFGQAQLPGPGGWGSICTSSTAHAASPSCPRPPSPQFGYRGVVFGWDRSCERDAEWQRQMNIRDGSQPFYHCLPDEGDAIRLFGGGERAPCSHARRLCLCSALPGMLCAGGSHVSGRRCCCLPVFPRGSGAAALARSYERRGQR